MTKDRKKAQQTNTNILQNINIPPLLAGIMFSYNLLGRQERGLGGEVRKNPRFTEASSVVDGVEIIGQRPSMSFRP